MKQEPKHSALQKALTFVMVVFVFVVATVIPDSRNSNQGLQWQKKESVVSESCSMGIPALPASIKPLLKLSVSGSHRSGLLLENLLSKVYPVQETLAIPVSYLVRKINFIFVSAKAP